MQSNYVEAVQTRQGLFVSCLEEIAYRQGYISKEQLLELAKPLLKTEYGQYLVKIADEVAIIVGNFNFIQDENSRTYISLNLKYSVMTVAILWKVLQSTRFC